MSLVHIGWQHLSEMEYRQRIAYHKFLVARGISHYADPTLALALYLEYYCACHSAASLTRVLHALIRGAHILGEQDIFIGPGTRLVINRHIRKLELENPRETRRAPPLLYGQLVVIERRLMPHTHFVDLMALSLIRLCFENGIRAGEATRFRMGGVRFVGDSRLEIIGSYSKTSRGKPIAYWFHDTHEKFCAVKLLKFYRGTFSDIWLNPDDYLFPNFSVSGSRTRPRLNVHPDRALSTQWLAFVLKDLSVKLDFFGILRCHSLRAGFACALMLAGIPLAEIQKLGRWSSDTYLIYLRDALFLDHIRDSLVQKTVNVGCSNVGNT